MTRARLSGSRLRLRILICRTGKQSTSDLSVVIHEFFMNGSCTKVVNFDQILSIDVVSRN
jgi:hypothetical protein